MAFPSWRVFMQKRFFIYRWRSRRLFDVGRLAQNGDRETRRNQACPAHQHRRHARVDYKNCAHGIAGVNNGEPYCPNLAALGKTGVNYVAASTSKPSDSFPGLMTIVSGATPRTMGVYYDVAYDRSLDGRPRPPATATRPRPATPPSRPPATPRNTKKASTSTRPS